MSTIWIQRALALASLSLLALMTGTQAQAQSLKQFTVTPPCVKGGAKAVGWALLSAKAPSGGATLTLSSDQTYATVPSTVTVKEGERGVTFPITTTAVQSDGTANVTVLDGSGKSLSAKLKVTAPVVVALKGVGLAPTKLVAGTSGYGAVELNVEAPTGGFAVSLSFDKSFAAAPASVTVPAGKKSVPFSVTASTGSSGDAVLTATDGGGHSATAKLSVTTLGLRAFTLDPGSVLGGKSAKGRLQLNGKAPTGGLSLALSSSQTYVHFPATVTVAAGKESAEFAVTTDAGANGDATLSASDGTTTLTAKLTVKTEATDIRFVGSGDGPFLGGSTLKGFVLLTAKAPSGGETITLVSDNAAVQPPSTVLVPEGQIYVPFSLPTSAVSAKTIATVTGTDGNGKTATNKITLLPNLLLCFKLGAERLTGGKTATGTLALAAPAGSGGYTLTLTSDSTLATVPATVLVAEGSKTAIFTVTTTAVTENKKVTLTATDTYGIKKTVTLILQPASPRP